VNTLTLEGRVFTGEGNGKKFLSLPWVRQQIEENLGFTPFLGTLNLKLTWQSAPLRKQLENAKAVIICPAEGYCVGLLFKALIGKEKCAAILPQIKDYPENVLEIIAPVNLRAMLSLVDDDSVTVTVQA
jgi:riboflavin kinase